MSHSRPHFNTMRPSGRLVMEVVIPVRKRIHNNDSDYEPQITKTPTRPFKRNRNRRMSNNDDDEEYSPGPGSETFLASPLRVTRRSRRAPSVSSSLAGPSGDQLRGTTPSEPMSISGSSSSSSSILTDSLQSLTTAADFLTDPDAILVEAGDDLRMVTSTSPAPEDTISSEVKPAFEIDPVHHEVDTSKLSPEPEYMEMEDPGIDCAICYESMGDVCKKAEEEGNGGIGGGLAIFACEQPACGGIFCIGCIVEAANHSIRNRKPVACPLCTRRTDVAIIRAQAMAFNPADASDPIIDAPLPPPPPPPRAIPANQRLRDQHVKCVIDFHIASRPGQRYFVNSFNEFAEYLKSVNPAAAEANPIAMQWLATSAWEAFWSTHQGKAWRGLPRLRANSFLMTVIKGLDIKMPADNGMTDRLAAAQVFARADPVVRFDLPPLPADEDLPEFVRARLRRLPPGAREAMVEARQRAREARAARIAAQDPDEVRANEAILRLQVPAVPPAGLVGPEFTPLGAQRPVFIHHRAGFDLMLQEHRSENARRGWMRMMFALTTDREADILYANLRRAYNLDMVNPEVPPTAAELERMQIMRHAWALINEGRQALMAAQAHQLPVAVFNLPEIPAPPVPAVDVDVVE